MTILKIIAVMFALVMSIGAASAQSCNNFPNILTNGQPADANQVMANFNYIANCVNNLTTPNDAIINCTLVASVASNNLTVALKTNAGADPSASNPCVVSFRNAGAATGNYVVVQVTSATSIVLNSGSSLGALGGNIPFRIWVEAFNDGGTFRLALSNQSVSTQIFPLNEAVPQSATQCNACSSATSAGIFYAAAPITSKAMRILGYMEWGSGLATAGAWSSGPTLIQLFGPGIKKPGETVQKRYVNLTQTSTTSSSFQPVTGSISFALTSAANIVQAMYTGSIFIEGTGVSGFTALARDGSTVGNPSHSFSGAGLLVDSMGKLVFERPNDTSSHTYQVYLRNHNNTTTVNYPWANGAGGELIVEEIMG